MLRGTDCVGRPAEWFNTRYIQAYGEVFGYKQVDFSSYLDFVRKRTTTPNGVFSVNFHVEQWKLLLDRGLDVMRPGFDRVYWVYRRDKLAQAHSLHRAQVTDQWSSQTDTRAEFDPDTVRPSDLLKALTHIAQSEEAYRAHLHPKVNREFAYEDFADLEHTNAYRQVLDDCGVDLNDVPNLETNMERQSTGRTPPAVDRLKGWLRGEG